MRTLIAGLIWVWLLTPAYGAVKGEQIRQHVVRHIEQSMPWPKEAARIDVNMPPDIDGPEKKNLVVRVETVGNEEYVGEVTFMVRLSDGKVHRQVTVHGRIEIMRDVVVSGRPLARDTVISPDDVKVKKKWVRHLDPNLLSSPDDAVGKLVTMALRGGAELKAPMLKQPIMVRKGKTVRIKLDHGGMQITALGISEEDGVNGALIRVRNISSNRMIFAKVTGEDIVKIDY